MSGDAAVSIREEGAGIINSSNDSSISRGLGFDRSGLGHADPIILLVPDGSERADVAVSLAAAAAADPGCLIAKIETFQAFSVSLVHHRRRATPSFSYNTYVCTYSMWLKYKLGLGGSFENN